MYAPVEPMWNAPPLLPVTLEPTLPKAPLTALTVSGSRSRSLSFVRTLPLALVFSVVVFVSATAAGGSLTAPTEPLTVAVAVPPAPSLIVYVNEAGPL